MQYNIINILPTEINMFWIFIFENIFIFYKYINTNNYSLVLFNTIYIVSLNIVGHY